MTVTIPAAAAGHTHPVGVGLKAQHYDFVLDQQPDLSFFEVHAENYMAEGGAHHRYIEAIAERYRLSFHGVGMSLGSSEGLDTDHLVRFRQLAERYSPWMISEHLAWSRQGGVYLNDLLPLPLNPETLAIVADNVARMQDAVGQQILVENPSAYLAFKSSDIPEVEYLSALAERTGCGLLLDVNNVYVSAMNMDWDAQLYLDSVPSCLVGEIHLAGHLLKHVDDRPLRIDDHGSQVCDDVWNLYEQLIRRIGPRPTLIEWDTDVPAFPVLEAEAMHARSLMRQPAEGGYHG